MKDFNKCTIRAFRGQSAIEALVMAGFALAFVLPLALLFFAVTGSETGKTAISQAEVTTRLIAVEAGEIYLQGPGAKKTILVNYPDGIMNGSVRDYLVVLRIGADGRELDITSPTFANISGSLEGRRNSGAQRIKLVNVDGVYVNITYG